MPLRINSVRNNDRNAKEPESIKMEKYSHRVAMKELIEQVPPEYEDVYYQGRH